MYTNYIYNSEQEVAFSLIRINTQNAPFVLEKLKFTQKTFCPAEVYQYTPGLQRNMGSIHILKT